MSVVRSGDCSLMVNSVRDRVEACVVGRHTSMVLDDVGLHLLDGTHLRDALLLLFENCLLLGIFSGLNLQLKHSNLSSLGSQRIRHIVVTGEEVDALSVGHLIGCNVFSGNAALQPGLDGQEDKDAGKSEDNEGPSSGFLFLEVDFSPSSLAHPLAN